MDEAIDHGAVMISSSKMSAQSSKPLLLVRMVASLTLTGGSRRWHPCLDRALKSMTRLLLTCAPSNSGAKHSARMPRETRTTRTVRARTWLVCFGSASLLGVTLAWQRWTAWRWPEKPSFWSAEYLQPAMIPWYAWAVIAPILLLVLHQVASAEMTTTRRVARYAGLALLAI